MQTFFPLLSHFIPRAVLSLFPAYNGENVHTEVLLWYVEFGVTFSSGEEELRENCRVLTVVSKAYLDIVSWVENKCCQNPQSLILRKLW